MITWVPSILSGVNFHIPDWQNDWRIVQQIEDTEISPPHSESVRESGTWPCRAYDTIHWSASTSDWLGVAPCVWELLFIVELFGVELIEEGLISDFDINWSAEWWFLLWKVQELIMPWCWKSLDIVQRRHSRAPLQLWEELWSQLLQSENRDST